MISFQEATAFCVPRGVLLSLYTLRQLGIFFAAPEVWYPYISIRGTVAGVFLSSLFRLGFFKWRFAKYLSCLSSLTFYPRLQVLTIETWIFFPLCKCATVHYFSGKVFWYCGLSITFRKPQPFMIRCTLIYVLGWYMMRLFCYLTYSVYVSQLQVQNILKNITFTWVAI